MCTAPRWALFAARARQARRRGRAHAPSRACRLSVSPEKPYKQAPGLFLTRRRGKMPRRVGTAPLKAQAWWRLPISQRHSSIHAINATHASRSAPLKDTNVSNAYASPSNAPISSDSGTNGKMYKVYKTVFESRDAAAKSLDGCKSGSTD